MGHLQIKETVYERDLGVQIDNDLKFHDHAARVIKKCKSLLAIIKRCFACLDRRMITRLYKALIRPVLEYGNSVWGPCYKGDQDALEKLQRRTTKMVQGLRHVPYQDRLRQLDLPSLAYRRIRGDMIIIYKLITGKIQADTGMVQVERGPYRTRGHSLRMKKVRATKQVRRNYLLIRAVNKWNSLPERVVSAENTLLFKIRLDTFLKEQSIGIE